jgi:hypothetical protein
MFVSSQVTPRRACCPAADRAADVSREREWRQFVCLVLVLVFHLGSWVSIMKLRLHSAPSIAIFPRPLHEPLFHLILLPFFMPRNLPSFAAIESPNSCSVTCWGPKRPQALVSWDSVWRSSIFEAACGPGSFCSCHVLRPPDWVTLMLPCGAGWHDTWLH